MKYSAPKGTRDILPGESKAWQSVEALFYDVCRRYAYHEIRIPTFESTELFERGVGGSTDIVQKEMYSFEDKAGRPLTLRPEGTAGVVRAYLENGLASEATPLRLFYNVTAFRYEKMQKGRYREFHQLGCECIGSAAPEADVELISLLSVFFESIGLRDFHLEINSIGCPECRPAYREALRDYYQPHLQDLCDDCRRRFDQNPLRLLDCKEPSCRKLADQAPVQLERLCPDCREHWQEVLSLLDALGISYEINPRLVRGLDYYTRTVFEFVSDQVGTQGTICAGGRYDGLVEEMGGKETPAVGFAMGVERLLLELRGRGIPFPEEEPPLLFIAAFPSQKEEAMRLSQLGRAAGYIIDTDICGRSMKAQLKYANRRQTRYLLVLGEEEIKSGCAKIKRMSDAHEISIQLIELKEVLDTLQKEEKL